MSDNEPEQRRVHLHRDSDSAKEGENSLVVECPFCGEWEDVHTLQRDGCDCGAAARTELTFEEPPKGGNVRGDGSE